MRASGGSLRRLLLHTRRLGLPKVRPDFVPPDLQQIGNRSGMSGRNPRPAKNGCAMKAEITRQFGCPASQPNDLCEFHGMDCGVAPHAVSIGTVGLARPAFVGSGHNPWMEAKSTIGNRLRALRKERPGTNQVDVAAATNITRSHLSKLENDKDTPSRKLLSALAVYYGVSMDYLETGAAMPGAEGADQSIYGADDLAWARLGRELDPDQRQAVFDFINRIASRPRPGGSVAGKRSRRARPN